MSQSNYIILDIQQQLSCKGIKGRKLRKLDILRPSHFQKLQLQRQTALPQINSIYLQKIKHDLPKQEEDSPPQKVACCPCALPGRATLSRYFYAATLLPIVLCLFKYGFCRIGLDTASPLLLGVGLQGYASKTGVQGASLAGGTDIFFYGQGLSMYPSQNLVQYTQNGTTVAVPAPALTGSDEFRSNIGLGILAYSTPAISSLYGISMDSFLAYDSLAYQLSVLGSDSSGALVSNLRCTTASNCNFYMSRAFTPVVLNVNPSVVYFGAPVAITVDPKGTSAYKLSGAWPFTEARIDGHTVDFQVLVNGDSQLSSYSWNQVFGYVGDQPPALSSNFSMKFPAGYTLQQSKRLTKCTYDMSKCYQAQTVPKIDSISARAGYTTGGQPLIIRGHGFSSPNIAISLDGTPCVVTSRSQTQVVCVTSARAAPSANNTDTIGQHGLRRRIFNNSGNSFAFSQLTSLPYRELLATELETAQNNFTYYGNALSGWFKAPATTNYKFYLSCDDYCQLRLGTANATQAGASLILSSPGPTSFRNFWAFSGAAGSSWIPLAKDSYYFLEAQHLQGGGGEHLSVAVEIEQKAIPNHTNARNQIQRLVLNGTYVRDRFSFNATYPGYTVLTLSVRKFVYGPSGQPVGYDTVTYGVSFRLSSAQDIQDAFQPFYTRYCEGGCKLNVTKVWYDSNWQVTTDPDKMMNTQFALTPQKALYNHSFDMQTNFYANKSSTVICTGIQAWGTRPLAGNFKILCYRSDGSSGLTADIPSSASPYTIAAAIGATCTEYRDNIDVFDTSPDFPYADGRDFQIRFTGSTQSRPLFKIVNGTVPLANLPNQTTYSWEAVPPSTNIFYDPVPFDLLYTNETMPQANIAVDGQPAVCSGLACSYSYIRPSALITSFSMAGSQLTILGQDLPAVLTELTYSNIPCAVSSQSNTQILCEISPMAVSGVWHPSVKDGFGIIPVDGGAAAVTLGVTVVSVTPNSGLNPAGYNLLTIAGQNFPLSINDGNKLDVTFSDGTVCDVISTASSEITCMSRAFNPSAIASAINVIVTINGQVDSSLTVSASSAPVSVVAIVPRFTSPVLKVNLTLQLSSSFSGSLSTADLSVRFVSASDPTYFKHANVIAADSAKKAITVRFGGAPSGDYKVEVTSASRGAFDSSSLLLTTIGTVASISPSTGSVYGGQLITITGFNFSADPQDNPVQIGGRDCEVLSSSNTQITCRTPLRPDPVPATEVLLAFLFTSEEAVCSVPTSAGGCNYTWSGSNLPALTGYTANFDPSLGQHVLTFSGSGFTGDASSVQVLIDGEAQPVSLVTASSVTAVISSLSGAASSDVQIFFPQGRPSGYQMLEAGISLTPSLVQVSPSVGSPAGSLITATVSGVGPGLIGSVALLTAAGTPLCSEVEVVRYSQIRCKTVATAIPAAVSLAFALGSTVYACSNPDPSQCGYSTSPSMPLVTSSSVSADYTQLELAGSGFLTSGFGANLTYSGIQADSVTIVSPTAVSARFLLGVPTSATSITPSLVFVSSTSTAAHWAATTSAGVSNPYIASNTAATVTCSFAGGCLLTVQGRGLASNLKDASSSSVAVCNQQCPLSTKDSSLLQAQCTIPALATAYSISAFNISVPSDITQQGQFFASNPAYKTTLFDGNNLNNFGDASNNSYAGIQFKTGFVGILSQVKFYMNAFTAANFADNLKFQGSSDGSAYVTILTVGREIHTGWNYHDFKQDGTEPKYQYYRLFAQGAGGLLVGELVLTGSVAIADSNPYYSCTASLTLNGVTSQLATAVKYAGTSTPVLLSIAPRFGTVKGGTSVTFSGAAFDTDFSKYQILLDGVACTPTAATAKSVTCTTGKRPGLVPTSTLSIFIAGTGQVSTQGLLYIYVNLWSDTTTWGGEFQPMDGETVWIPAGLNLLFDIDKSPLLNAVLVEGSLLFAPNPDPDHHCTFDANYIFVNGGCMEVGTEASPYSSRLTVTMHGTKQSPEIPIYGNKVIGVRKGTLDIHGTARSPVWTELATTANPGDLTITLSSAVDWRAGEQIVVAPTSYSAWEAEQRAIVSVDNTDASAPVLTLDSALLYTHYAAVETHGGRTISMRAEVGLLTRNVVFRGDPETSKQNQYGAHIMLHSHGDESVIGRIEYAELFDVGQSFQLGRYPIHFHMIGTVHKSYVRGNSIHRTYNRAVTFHGVQFLRVVDNVAYDTMGHTFFVEDAIETNNILDGNLAILTKKSWSLLNTDQTPASFWITNPYNIVRNNRAAGSDQHGFWYDLQPHPTGPSYDPSICPDHMPLGEFSNNVAHSNGRYGLWLFHKHIPSTYPCEAIAFDPSKPADPYWQNPLVTADYTGFTAYKNGECGVMFEEIGAVRLTNAAAADNLVAGIEISVVSAVRNGRALVDGALVVGYSGNAEQRTLDSGCWGLITARSEGLSVHNVAFSRLDQRGMAALGSCSHCFHAAATDSGARTVEFSGLAFDAATVPRKIHYQFPWRAIYYDADGSLTGLGPKTWATPYWEHNSQPECQRLSEEFDGLICSSQVEVRRVAFYGYEPSALRGLALSVVKWDDALVGGLNATSLSAYKGNASAYSVVPFKQSKDPSNAWAVPFVTNHKYKVHWGRGSNDFTQMRVDPSNQWQATDQNLYLVTNFTATRARVNFTTGRDLQPNTTLLSKANNLLQTGDNVVYNDTATREIQFVINGRNSSKSSLLIVGESCIGSCLSGIGDETPVEDTARYWSDPKAWPSGRLPVAGEDVVINSTWNMILDLATTPVLNRLEVNGRLSLMSGMSITLQAKIIFVRAGELNVGNSTHPFVGDATVLLHGEPQSQTMVYENSIDGGNKMLANTAKVNIYGTPRPRRMSRLLAPASVGDAQLAVEPGLDWRTGDRIGLAPTAISHLEYEHALIAAYNSVTGVVSLDKPLSKYHWGAAQSTASLFSGVDMRGEVVLLSSNVQIRGTDTDSWGCQFITSDFLEVDGVQRVGRTFLDNVEVFNCSQYDNAKAALRFDSAYFGYSSVTNCALHSGLGWGFNAASASNILFKNNVLFDFRQFGVLVQESSNVTLDSNVVIGVGTRGLVAYDEFVDKEGGFIICAFDEGERCSGVRATNNIVAGAQLYGFAAPGHTCGDFASSSFVNNIAHSIRGPGAHIFADPNNPSSGTCLQGSYFSAYKCSEDGAVTFASTSSVIFSNMVLIDNGWGASINVGKEGESLSVTFKDSMVYGEAEARDCPQQNQCNSSRAALGCVEKHGFMLPTFAQGAKPVFPSGVSALPIDAVSGTASWGGSSQVQNVTFSNFLSSQTYCGLRQSVFGIEGSAADYVAPVYLSRTKFSNVEHSAVSYLYDPPQSWAVIDDCGEFPCTGPLNTYLSFSGTSFSGSATPDYTSPNFQILPNNPAAVRAFSTRCTLQKQWNAYYCNSDYVGLLLFESLDADKAERTFSPIYITSLRNNFANKLNEFMDRTWDGFYTGQIRLSRFPSLIQTGSVNSLLYNISYTGTPPSVQRFKLVAETGSLTARIVYPKAGTYSVQDESGNMIAPNAWDDSQKGPGRIVGQKCGENRFLGVVNELSFVLWAGCTLTISPVDSIQAKIRLQWDLASFYASGGSTAFVARFAAALGIIASDIKVVNVYQGSVIVQYAITSTAKNSAQVLTALRDKITTMIRTSRFGIDLGAPVLEGSFDQGEPITPSDGTGTQNDTTKGSDNEKPKADGTDGSTAPKANETISGAQAGNGKPERGGALGNTAKLAVIVSIAVIFLGVAVTVVVLVCVRHKKDTSMIKLGRTDQTAPGLPDEEEYEPQYHPKSELGNIFGSSADGQQRSKVNQADDIHGVSIGGHSEAEIHNKTEDSILALPRAPARQANQQQFKTSRGSPSPLDRLTKKASEGSPDEFPQRSSPSPPGKLGSKPSVVSRTPGSKATKKGGNYSNQLQGADSGDDDDVERGNVKQFSLRAQY